MVYTDGVHLIADSLDELHVFAVSVGLKKQWFQYHKLHPHYDITTKRKLKLVLEHGAVKMDAVPMFKLMVSKGIWRMSNV